MLSQAEMSDRPDPVAFDIGRRLPDERSCVITVEGDLDLAGAPRLKWMLVEALDAGCSQLVVDLSRTTLVDATALGALIGVNTGIEPDARLAIACAQPDVLRVFKASGLDRAFAILPTVDEALAHVSKEATRAG
jgi:anti-sigma B factor antagonist